jgi:polyhydroxyalkanoate synthesis regulator phasin
MATKTKTEAVKENIVQPSEETDQVYTLFDAARNVLLAGIGAMALAQEQIEDFVNRLIERGQIAEKDGRKLIQEIKEKRKVGPEKIEEKLNKHVERVLNRMNIASRSDIDALGQKIAELSKKLDETNKPS